MISCLCQLEDPLINGGFQLGNSALDMKKETMIIYNVEKSFKSSLEMKKEMTLIYKVKKSSFLLGFLDLFISVKISSKCWLSYDLLVVYLMLFKWKLSI